MLLFLNAPGGTEKMYLITAKQNCLKFRGKSVVAVVTSTVATKLLEMVGPLILRSKLQFLKVPRIDAIYM